MIITLSISEINNSASIGMLSHITYIIFSTITLFLKRAGALVWDKDNDFFSRAEEKIKESISEFPAYFHILNEVLCGRLTCDQAKELDSSVIEIWD